MALASATVVFPTRVRSRGSHLSRRDQGRVKKHIGWHTFLHSVASLLDQNGEDVKVVQELLRLAATRITIEVYRKRKGMQMGQRSLRSPATSWYPGRLAETRAGSAL